MQHAAGRPDPYGSVTQAVNRWERVMRIRFMSYLAMGVISTFLIVSSYAFTASTFKWIAFGGGIALAAVATIDLISARRRLFTAAPAALIAVVGVVMAILALTLANVDVDNAAFGMSIATGILSVLGLWAHELATEQDVRTLAEPPLAP